MAFTSREKTSADNCFDYPNSKKKTTAYVRKILVTQHISLRDDKGAFENLVKWFRDDEKEDFAKFLRCEHEQFNFILGKITH